VRTFVVVVLDEFPVEWESSVFFVVGSEPPFNLALRGGFADASEDVFDSFLVTVRVEGGFASADAPELAAMVGEDLAWFRVFMYRLVEEPDHVLCCAVFEDLAACDVAAVVV